MESITTFASEVMLSEAAEIKFEEVVEVSNADYYVKPTYVDQYGGAPNICYGIFNRDTGVMEADTRQIAAAAEWAEVLQKMKTQGPPEPIIKPMTEQGGMLN